AQIHSYALRDKGVDVMFDIADVEVACRVTLGDMCFVARPRRDGSYSQLYFMPEYPNNELGWRRKVASYYALALLSPKLTECELKVTDPSLRLIDWSDGVAIAKRTMDAADDIKAAIKRIVEIDELVTQLRPNMGLQDMREAVGPASGARFLM